MSLPKNSLFLLCTLLVGASLAAQRARPPVLLGPRVPDPGVPVEMFESANLDRFLRKAQNFLSRAEYGNAIRVLQDVIEGRTMEFTDVDGDPEKRGEEKGKEKKPDPKKNELPIDDDNPAYSVFSSDERIYRPVSRLCHELLASMPPEGIGLYRDKYEAFAKVEYEAAMAKSDLPTLEAVYNHYFATIHSAYAMRAAADLLMDAGRFRAAIQTLEILLEIYPEDSRREAGIRDKMLMVQVAICFQQLGETELAKEQLDALVRVFPQDSVRLMGELYTLKDVHESDLFDARNIVAPEHKRNSSFTLELQSADGLVPLWEFRYTEPKPYQTKKSIRRNSRSSFRMPNRGRGVPTGTMIPRHNASSPGTTVTFQGRSIVFMDNYRTVVHELTSGRQTQALGEEELAKTRFPAINNAPRARTPVYDFFANRVAMDDKRYYVVQGNNRPPSTSSFKAIHKNTLVAYDKLTGASVWSINSQEDKKRPITFLATPTVYRNTLLVPFLDAGSYGMMCLGSADGGEIYRTYLHYRGTEFARAPSPPVVVNSGIAYTLTNAGVLAAVDANTGVLIWSRKYERVHPTRTSYRPTRRIGRNNIRFRRGVYTQPKSFRGFAPSDLYVIDDLVIVAAVDSTALLCINGATGEIAWLHNGEDESSQNVKVLAGEYKYVVGHNKDYLFLMCGDLGTQLLCIGIKSGLRYWARELPGVEYRDWAGRGFVTDDYVVLPGNVGTRQIHVIPANTKKLPKFKTIELPDFSISKEPMTGPANLFVDGAYLALCYEGGVEVYSSPKALAMLAGQGANPSEKASYLVHAGKLEDAIKILFAELDRDDLTDTERRRQSIRVLSLVDEVSALLATNGHRKEALAILDECEQRMGEVRLTRRVHLFRLQVYRTLGDLTGIEREQEFIETGGVR